MTRPFAFALVAVALAGAASLASGGAGSYSGPAAAHTGAGPAGIVPAEPNCTQCHAADPGVPNLDQPGGWIAILDLPPMYAPGVTYRMRVRLDSDKTLAFPGHRWGFQLTAVRAADGAGAGTFAVRGAQVPGPGGDTLWVNVGSGAYANRRYVEHLFEGTHVDESGPVEWSFDWTAPAEGTGTVLFYAAGNAGNGSDDPSGDWIYTTADSMRDTTTAVRASSWGAIKARWR
jgi:hypothetical protein